MTAAEGSFLGLAIQSGEGVAETRDAQFRYLLFTEGGIGPQSQVIPLDPEIGGGALLRSMVKVGVTSSGVVGFIPRPETLGFFLLGATGSVSTSGTSYYTHVFTLPEDQFEAPYFTARFAPGAMWGEQFLDCRVNMLSLEWRGANFVRGNMSFLGGTPSKVSTSTWSALDYVDSGPQFLSPVSDIELPTGTNVDVLAGSFIANMNIPLDEQFVVGSYAPQGLDLVSRAFQVNLTIKIDDADLYTKINYDPSGGSSWTANIFREGRIKLLFNSDQEVSTGVPYSFKIEANGQASSGANVFWSAQPLALRAQRQVVMNVTGLFAASPNASYDPITITLVNSRSSYEYVSP